MTTNKIKSPAFQFYAADYLASTRVSMMTLEEQGAYWRLLCHCWLNGSIPKDPEKCDALLGKGGSTTLATKVQAMFIQDPSNPDQLIHERLEVERLKQSEWRKKSSEGGKMSASARIRAQNSRVVEPPLQPPLPPTGQPNVNQQGNQMSTLLSSSSSSSSKKNICPVESDTTAPARFAPPTLEMVKLQGAKIGLPEIECQKFINFYESKGWLVGKSKMKSWQHAMSNWKLNCQGIAPKPQKAQNEPYKLKGPRDPMLQFI